MPFSDNENTQHPQHSKEPQAQPQSQAQPQQTLRQPKNYRRHPEHYDGPKKTIWQASDIAATVVQEVTRLSREQPELILAAWAHMMADRADRIQAECFVEGVLYVRVKNSTLFSLINVREKEQYLSDLRKRFPKTKIHAIVYRMR